jgi:hypothetical protein
MFMFIFMLQKNYNRHGLARFTNIDPDMEMDMAIQRFICRISDIGNKFNLISDIL